MMLLALMMMVPAKAPAEPVCAPRPGDAAAITRTVQAFYEALGRDDRAAFERTVTSDFTAFEYADRFDAGQLFQLVADAHREDVKIVWGVGPLTIKVDCQTAWAHWDNRGSSGKDGKMTPRRWRESAVLRRAGDGWRIELFHSTAAARP